MWSGGLPSTPVAASSSAPADIEALGKQYSDANEYLQECSTDLNYARQSEQEMTSRVKSSDDALSSVQDMAGQNKQAIKGEYDQLVPEDQRILSDWQLAMWQDARYCQEYADQYTMAILQKMCEDKNWGGCALLAFFKACLNMGRAIIGSSSSPGELSLFSYLRIPELLRNQAVDTRARTQSSQESQNARREAVRKKEADSGAYYDGQIRDKKAKAAEGADKLAAAKSTLANATSKVEGAKATRDAARQAYSQAAGEQRDVQQPQGSPAGAATGADAGNAGAAGNRGASGTGGTQGGGGLKAPTPAQMKVLEARYNELVKDGYEPKGLSKAKLLDIAKIKDADWPAKKAELEKTLPKPPPVDVEKRYASRIKELDAALGYSAILTPDEHGKIRNMSDAEWVAYKAKLVLQHKK